MKKDFLTITPESGGGGTASVNVTADPNPNFKSRETSLTFSATGRGAFLHKLLKQFSKE